MTSRERILTALKHKEPDRIPLDLGGTVTTIERVPYNKLKKYFGIKGETKIIVREHVDPDDEILEKFEIDTRYVRIKPPNNWRLKLLSDNSYIDEWGTKFKKPKSSLYYDPVPPYPLDNATSIKEIKRYPWPDSQDPGRIKGLEEEARNLYENTDYAIIADIPFLGPLECSWQQLRGPKFLEDLIINKSFAKALLEKIANIQIQIFDKYLDAVGKYIQVVMVSEDLGVQNSTIISPKLYREMIKPIHAKLWGYVKKKTDAYLFLHSCGSVYALIPDIIELGVDILNPVQVSAKNMDTKRLKKEFGTHLTFWGGVDTQRVMPNGSLEEVEKEVKRRIKDLAPGGGYVLTAVHSIQPDVKPENICCMYESAKKYGTYSLK